jgi:preprotein translocase subunit SecG
MLVLFGILVIIACIVLGFIVLVQNPKGGGIAGSLGGFSNQLIGVKQSTDIMEKGTWIFAAIVGILCLISPAFIPGEGKSSGRDAIDEISTRPQTQQQAPAKTTPPAGNTVPLPGTQTPAPQTTTPTTP